MAYGIKALRKLQIGKEATKGTIVAATTIFRGEGTIEDTRETVFPNEDIGLVSPTDRAYQPKLGAKLSLASTPATFEQLPYILTSGVKALTTGVADGAGAGKIYAYPLSTTAQNDFTTLTIEGGDNVEAEVMEYAFVTDFEISGKAGEAVMMTANFEGRQVALQAFTGALSVPTVEEILTSTGKVYSDAVGGTLGTTQIANEILSFSYKVQTGIVPVWTADGSLYFSFAKMTRPTATLDLVFEHSTKAQAAKVLWRAGTPAQLRLKFEGSAINAGTAYSKKTMIIDIAGKYEKANALADDNGDDIVTMTFRGGYDSTAALFSNVTVVNTLASLT